MNLSLFLYFILVLFLPTKSCSFFVQVFISCFGMCSSLQGFRGLNCGESDLRSQYLVGWWYKRFFKCKAIAYLHSNLQSMIWHRGLEKIDKCLLLLQRYVFLFSPLSFSTPPSPTSLKKMSVSEGAHCILRAAEPSHLPFTSPLLFTLSLFLGLRSLRV